MNHDEITRIVAPNGYGKGVEPNPFADAQPEWKRRKDAFGARQSLTAKIKMLMEPRFITPPETSEFIESLITLTDSRKVLEVGTCTGFTTLHMLRAVIGKQGAKVVSVDARPAHDREYWKQYEPTLEFVEGWTPDVLRLDAVTRNAPYDLVFVDSDHSIEHTIKELEVLYPITKPGAFFLFHDVPAFMAPNNPQPPPIRTWLYEQVQKGYFHGVMLPSCEQADCLDVWGPGYPKECNPGIGIFVRR